MSRTALAIIALAALLTQAATAAFDAQPQQLAFTQAGRHLVSVTTKTPGENGIMITKTASIQIEVAGAAGFGITGLKNDYYTTDKITPKISWATKPDSEDDDDEELYGEATREVTLANIETGEETQLARTASGQFALPKQPAGEYYLVATTRFNNVKATAKSNTFTIREKQTDASNYKITTNKPAYNPKEIITAMINWPEESTDREVALYTLTGSLVRSLNQNPATDNFYTTAPEAGGDNEYVIAATCTVRGKPLDTISTQIAIATPTPAPQQTQNAGGQQNANSNTKKTTVVLDPGHGKGSPNNNDAGARTINGVEEASINLAIAQKTKAILEKQGYRVVMTRNDANAPPTWAARYGLGAQADALVSIHCNAMGEGNNIDRSAKGTETYYKNYYTPPAKTAKNKKLAQSIQNAVVKSIGTNDLGIKTFPKGNDKQIFTKMYTTTTLVEVGFLTNPEEGRYLASETGQQKAAQGIANGITGYLAQPKVVEQQTKQTECDPSGKGNSAFDAAAKRYDVDPLLLCAIAKTESDFQMLGPNSASAVGYMQITPPSADYNCEPQFKGSYKTNLWSNVHCGGKEIRFCLNAFGQDIKLALACYNAGIGNVKKYGGIPPFRETQAYVPRVLEHYNAYKNNGGKPIPG